MKTSVNFRWLVTMAWRDSRRSRSRLFLFLSSIVLGIAALVAIYSFEQNVRNDINQQAKELVGADLMIWSNKPVSPEAQALLDSLGSRRSQEKSFVSMIYFQQGGGTRLVQVKALEGAFPYYGAIETTPAEATQSFRNQQQALLDKTLMLQFGARNGDSIQLGNVSFSIAGMVTKAPGQTGISLSVAPVVYIPMRYLEQTGLLQKGSRIRHTFYYQYEHPKDVDAMVATLEPRFEKEGLYVETVQSQKEETSRSFDDLTNFLSLVGFIALLLGCVGVASAIHIYVREKIASIAILRCLGANVMQAFLIYLLQIIGVGLIGSIVGAALGVGIQQLLPLVLKDLLPLEVSLHLSWAAITQGIALGVLISALFALLPLVSVRNISPLNTLRISFEHVKAARDPLRWAIYGLVLLFIFGFTVLHLRTWKEAAFFTGSVVAAFGVLSGIAWLVIRLTKRFFPSGWSYLWRQGFANLFRPNNQTLILMVTVGLGTAFICTLYFVQTLLIQRVTLAAREHQPNMVLFDIQPKQKDSLAGLTRQLGLPVMQQVPIVTMRLEEINGKGLAEALEDTTSERSPRRAFLSEYRVTYRDTLIDSERLSAGKWTGTVAANDTPRISVDENFARRLKLQLDDRLLFNVQGVLIPAIVGSFREVEWNRIQTNFRVVFPKGVLEEAPQFYVQMTRLANEGESARFQQAVVRRFPNVSIIDLNLILDILDDIMNKIGLVIRFMAGFSIATGLIVLIASVHTSKYQRLHESILLRTLGASRRQVLAITALEYFFLGALAAATGIVLSLIGSWALARYSFETPFHPTVWPVLVVFVSIALLTMLVGIFNSRGILNRPPLEVLRKE